MKGETLRLASRQVAWQRRRRTMISIYEAARMLDVLPEAIYMAISRKKLRVRGQGSCKLKGGARPMQLLDPREVYLYGKNGAGA